VFSRKQLDKRFYDYRFVAALRAAFIFRIAALRAAFIFRKTGQQAKKHHKGAKKGIFACCPNPPHPPL